MPRQLTPAGRGVPSKEEIQGNPLPKIATKKGGKVKTVIAFDLGVNCIGWALAMDGQLMLYGKFVFKKGEEIPAKLSIFREYLETLLEVYEPDVVVVEKPVSRKGDTTHRHYELLGVVKETVFTTLGYAIKDAWVISALTVKSLLKVPTSTNPDRRKRHDENKAIMCRRINELYGLGLKFENSKQAAGDDIADAIAVLTAYLRRGKE
jgi:RNase H-fold protein (predicted Holliday junction resolvase)